MAAVAQSTDGVIVGANKRSVAAGAVPAGGTTMGPAAAANGGTVLSVSTPEKGMSEELKE